MMKLSQLWGLPRSTHQHSTNFPERTLHSFSLSLNFEHCTHSHYHWIWFSQPAHIRILWRWGSGETFKIRSLSGFLACGHSGLLHYWHSVVQCPSQWWQTQNPMWPERMYSSSRMNNLSPNSNLYNLQVKSVNLILEPVRLDAGVIKVGHWKLWFSQQTFWFYEDQNYQFVPKLTSNLSDLGWPLTWSQS